MSPADCIAEDNKFSIDVQERVCWSVVDLDVMIVDKRKHSNQTLGDISARLGDGELV